MIWSADGLEIVDLTSVGRATISVLDLIGGQLTGLNDPTLETLQVII
ncbi:MAG: hypothetical protein HC910_12170 [Spirulinaceae cyanobacterium SM2_1_0]|nr:hypothetical protein [Spirulinaceae cyanobacterium SM2_1_0]